MKKIFMVILSILLIFASCQKPNADEWGIALSVEDVKPTGLTLVITQSGGKTKGTLEYGSYYSLEVLENGNWVNVPYKIDNVSWTLLSYIIPKNQTIEKEINWDWLYSRLSPGNYRIGKKITDFQNGKREEKTYYAEFELVPKSQSGFYYGEVKKANEEIWKTVDMYKKTKNQNPSELNELLDSLAGGSFDDVFLIINVDIRDLTDQKIETFKKYIMDKDYIEFHNCDYITIPT